MNDDVKQQRDPEEEGPGPDPVQRIPYTLEAHNLEMVMADDEGVAAGWDSWVAEDNEFGEVEFVPVEVEGVPRQGFFSHGRYDAGVWQPVRVEAAGMVVTISMDFLVIPDDDERERPRSLVVGLGIDPFGGTDGQSPTVQWALTDVLYNTSVRASVTAVAQSEEVTIFVRSTAFEPGSTTVASNGAGVVCVPNMCAREDYDRIYILLPPGASAIMWRQVADAAANARWTIGGSADDAGLASRLLGQTAANKRPLVVCIDPNAWNSGNGPLSQAWYNTNYPLTRFVSVSSNLLANTAAFIQFVQIIFNKVIGHEHSAPPHRAVHRFVGEPKW
ncbi:MAG: hypothetical protein HC804_06295 [Anaerolineae bacterium]|nr:hypothetical protein [Anaerolineae bacterium]